MVKPALHDKVIVWPAVDADQQYTGIVFEVVGHPKGSTNIDIEATGPGAEFLGRRKRLLRISPLHVEPAPAGADAHTTATSVLVPLQSLIPLGAVFTVPNNVLPGVDETTLLVVLGTSGPAYKAARLGGDNDRYFPKVARAAMTVVPLDELAKRLPA